jgi:hypothetical protein
MCCGRVGHRKTLSRIEAFFDFKKADNWHLNIGQIPPAAGFPTLHVVLARRRLSVMVLRNSHPDATWFGAALSMIEIFDLGEPASGTLS